MDLLNQTFWKNQEILFREVFFPIVIGSLLLSLGLIVLFLLSFWRQHYRLWHLGKAEDCSGHWATRLKTVFAVALGHRRIWRELFPGTMHFLIFWGILLIFLGKIIRLFFYPVGLTTPPQPLFLYASLFSEIGGAMVIAGGLLGFVRR